MSALNIQSPRPNSPNNDTLNNFVSIHLQLLSTIVWHQLFSYTNAAVWLTHVSQIRQRLSLLENSITVVLIRVNQQGYEDNNNTVFRFKTRQFVLLKPKDEASSVALLTLRKQRQFVSTMDCLKTWSVGETTNWLLRQRNTNLHTRIQLSLIHICG